jgi:DNA-binding transcriptional LysR family regulator
LLRRGSLHGDRPYGRFGEGGLDLAIHITPGPESDLIVRRVAIYDFVVCGASEYLIVTVIQNGQTI